MRRRLIILLFLLVAASILLDLCLIRVSREQPSKSKDLSDFLRVVAAAFMLAQTNLATLCFGLCTLPLILRLGWIAAIAMTLVWLAVVPQSSLFEPLREATVIAAESLVASWLLKSAGYKLLVPGDDLPNLADQELWHHLSLSKLFGLTSIAAITSFLVREMLFGSDPRIVGLALPGFVLSTIVTMWCVLSYDHIGRRYGIALSLQLLILAICVIFGPFLFAVMWAVYCMLALGYVVVLRVMGIRLYRYGG